LVLSLCKQGNYAIVNKLGVLGCAVLVVSLAGCGGSKVAQHGVLSTDAGTMGKALDDGTVLSANTRTVRGIQNNASTGLATPVASTLSLGKGADGKFTMTLNGEAVTFDGTDTIGSDNAPGVFEQPTTNGGTASIVSLLSSDINDLGDPTSIYYSYPIRASITQPDGTETFVYAVLGTETLPSALSGLPAATYTGRFMLESLQEMQPGPWEDQVSIGDFSLVADFARGEVSGSLSNFYFYNPATGEFDDFAGAAYVVLDRTAIIGNGYVGTVSLGSAIPEPGTTYSGGYSGTFFGPAAEETGGALWFVSDGFVDDGSGSIPTRWHEVGMFNSVP
jgi:hypothetical protein